jgi:hypothetical protein
MMRLLDPFVLALTAILAVAYAYLAWRLARGAAAHSCSRFPSSSLARPGERLIPGAKPPAASL